MSINFTLAIGENTLPPNTCVMYTLNYGDQIMIDLFEATTEHLDPPSNFSHFDGWAQETYWSSTAGYYRDVDHDFLEDVQPRDGAELRHQMNWLVNDSLDNPNRPLWYKDGLLRCGHHVMGHNAVLIEADSHGVPVPYVFTTSYPAHSNVIMPILFYNAIGMPRSMMTVIRSEIAQGIDPHKKYPWWIQRANSAIWVNGQDKIDWYPAWRLGMESGGKVFYVFWSKEDWETNTGTAKMFLPASGLVARLSPEQQPPCY